jgi:hypothetical protein
MRVINTTIYYKPILKCSIFELCYLHPTTCFDLKISSSDSLRIHMSLLKKMDPFFYAAHIVGEMSYIKNLKLKCGL